MMSWLCNSLVVFTLLTAVTAGVPLQRNFTIIRELVIDTTQGPVKGAVIETNGPQDGVNVHIGQFLGINFAKVPVGEFRFAHPIFNTWDFVEDVQTYDRICYQDPGSGNYERMEEGCIAANIWTPYNGTSQTPGRHPVLVWIHGGRFETGSISDQSTTGRVLTSHEDLVTVSLQYRLGVFGFLRLGQIVPGNMGLKDQALGLEFVHKNIERFGGDLSTVTLMGSDAGAASIGYHMMNEQTSQYFHRAVMLGGSPLVFWSVRADTKLVEQQHLNFAIQELDCPAPDQSGNFNATVQCLIDVSATKLIEEQIQTNEAFQGIEFPPVIDGDYIKEDPLEAFQKGNFNGKSLMIGVTNAEAAVYVQNKLISRGWTKDDLADEQKYKLAMTENFQTYNRAPDLMTQNAREFMIDRYSSFGEKSADANYQSWLNAASDRIFVCPTNDFAHAAYNKLSSGSSGDGVYFYVFSEQDNFANDYEGAAHGSDAYYFFGNPSDDAPIVKPEQKLLSDRMMDYLAKFVADGDPVPRDNDLVWSRFNESHKFYHNFNTNLSAGYTIPYGFHWDNCAFWDKTMSYVNSLSSPNVNPLLQKLQKQQPQRQQQHKKQQPQSQSEKLQDNEQFEEADCSGYFSDAATGILVALLISNVALIGAAIFLFMKYKSLSA